MNDNLAGPSAPSPAAAQELLSVVLTVKPASDVVLPARLGRAMQSWLLDRIRAATASNPELRGLAGELHDGSSLRCYTASGLLGTETQSQPKTLLKAGQPAIVRLTSYAPHVTSLLQNKILPEALAIDIDKPHARLEIAGVATTPRDHAWARQDRFQDMLARHLSAKQPARTLTLQFLSPTLFKSDGRYLPAPLPRLVFGGLARRWDQQAPVKTPSALEAAVEQHVTLDDYKLRTSSVSFNRDGTPGGRRGFVGVCRFRIDGNDRNLGAWLHLLAEFALYAGVGLWTSQGCGQARAAP